MNSLYWEWFWQPTILAGVISFLVCSLVVRFGTKLKIIDDPKKHLHPKVTHDRPVPRGGGIPIFIALVVAGGIFLGGEIKIWAVLGAGALLAGIGYLDDRFEEKISPYLRLAVNLAAAGIVIAAGVGIAYISNPLGGVIRLDNPWYIAPILAVVWLVWMQNIVGWSSGVDGQLPGFVVIAAVTIAMLGIRSGSDISQKLVVILAGIIAGAYAGFWPWNWFPQKLMTGYGGKSLAGFLLGVLAIFSVARVGTLFLVLGVPIIDAMLVIIKRIREGRSPVWGGREHLHHMLLDRGWSKKQIAWLYTGYSALLAILALQLKAGAKYFTMAAVILFVSATIWWLQYWSTYSKPPGRDSG